MKTCKDALYLHVASFEYTLSFGRKGLLAGLPPGSVCERQGDKDQYVADGIVLPAELSYLYAGGGDILSAELPTEIVDDIQQYQSTHGCGGMKYASAVRYEAVVAAS